MAPAFSRTQDLHIMFVEEFIILVGADGGAVPRFDAEKWSLFVVRGPERYGGKARISNLDPFPAFPVDQGDLPGPDLVKVYGVLVEQAVAQRDHAGT